MWRTDVAANSGIDPVRHRRELVLNTLAFLRMYGRMQPRSKSSPAADPRSCMAKLYAEAREHRKYGYKMALVTLLMQVMKGQLRHYVELHGTQCLAPARKKPLTKRADPQDALHPRGFHARSAQGQVGILFLGLGNGDLLHAGID